MTIFKEILDEEYLTTAETKTLLDEIEQERALDEDREFPYELARTIEHVNQFTTLGVQESQELVDKLAALDTLNDPVAYKIANLLPRDRDELRVIFSQNRHSLDGEELDEILAIIAEYVEIS